MKPLSYSPHRMSSMVSMIPFILSSARYLQFGEARRLVIDMDEECMIPLYQYRGKDDARMNRAEYIEYAKEVHNINQKTFEYKCDYKTYENKFEDLMNKCIATFDDECTEDGKNEKALVTESNPEDKEYFEFKICLETLSIDTTPTASVSPSSTPTTSVSPSSEPSLRPSIVPTTFPSSEPSSKPSPEPSSEPSGVPSIYPSSDPSSDPSSGPSFEPSQDPSRSISPSSRPSSKPSSEPSQAPSTTKFPSSKPSLQPSLSALPSALPPALPSTLPTPSPTITPPPPWEILWALLIVPIIIWAACRRRTGAVIDYDNLLFPIPAFPSDDEEDFLVEGFSGNAENDPALPLGNHAS